MLRKLKRLTHNGLKIICNQGFSIFFQRVQEKVSSRLRVSAEEIIPSVDEYVKKYLIDIKDFSVLKTTRSELRTNLVLDSLGKNSLFGGVATAIIFATLVANRLDCTLRIISRCSNSHPRALLDFLKLMHITIPNRLEFYSDKESDASRLEVSEQDIFIATSWWSVKAIEKINLRAKFYYILQEVESLFYANNDQHFLSESVLNHPQIHYIINSKVLKDYYSEQGYNFIVKNCHTFEPAFPKKIYERHDLDTAPKEKYRLFFYARPKHERNLFMTGLKLLDQALLRGIIKYDEWEIIFAGSSEIPPILFTNGVRPINMSLMGWEQYHQFLKKIDLGFSLMYSPHPSYPPLDVAASGGVVLTNTYKNKKFFPESKNILCADLDVEAMMIGFEKAVNLAKNCTLRKQHYLESNFSPSWEKSFEPFLNDALQKEAIPTS